MNSNETEYRTLELATNEIVRMVGFAIFGGIMIFVAVTMLIFHIREASFEIGMIVYFVVFVLGVAIFHLFLKAILGWIIVGRLRVSAIPKPIEAGTLLPISIEFLSYNASNLRELSVELYYLDGATGASVELELAKATHDIERIGSKHFCSVEISSEVPAVHSALNRMNFLRVNFSVGRLRSERVFRLRFDGDM